MPNTFTILHLTDTHLMGNHALHHGKVDTNEMLRNTLEFTSGISKLDLIVCSGDITDIGELEGYQLALDLLKDFAEQRGAELVLAMGNHDRRENFRRVFYEGQAPRFVTSQLAPQDWDALTPHSSPIASAAIYGDLKVIVLDSSVPDEGYGVLDEEQLLWLEKELAKNDAPAGTVLVMHHPPVEAETYLLNALALRSVSTLEDVVRNSNVRLILAGHYHFQLQQSFVGIPVIVGSAVANQFALFEDPETESARFGSGGSLITLKGSRDYRVLPFTVPDERATERVFTLDKTQVKHFLDGINWES